MDSKSSWLTLAEQCFMMLLQMPHWSLMMGPLMNWALSRTWGRFPQSFLALSSAWFQESGARELTPVGYISKNSVPSGFWIGLANMSTGRQGRKKRGLFLLLPVCPSHCSGNSCPSSVSPAPTGLRPPGFQLSPEKLAPGFW